MKQKTKNFFIIFLIILGFVFVSFSQAKPEPLKRKIVVFKPGIEEEVKEKIINSVGGEKIKDLKLIGGKAILLNPQAEKNLLKKSEILRIDEDVEVFALIKSTKINRIIPQPAQILPWGIDRIDAEKAWQDTTANSIKIGVLDTGIDLTHPDLKMNIKGGYNAINSRKLPQDDNGHGTHVAGIIAALNNTIGVVGVGPEIDLYAIKVLGASGSGYLSDVIEGLEWAVSNGIQVVNMSLGTDQDIQSFREAIKKAYGAGVTMVAAAGNDGGSVDYPAAYPEVIAVSATDEKDEIASWSSRGGEIDLAAPGVNIYSTYKGSTYKILSGTSMAAPHVTGVAALVIDSKKCDYDKNGICSPSEVQQRLEETAIDLAPVGKDILYGFGLVNAERALNY